MAPSPLLVAREMPYADLAALFNSIRATEDDDESAAYVLASDYCAGPDDEGDEAYEAAIATQDAFVAIILSRLAL